MKQYCITAHDFTDEDALNRRMKVREEHFEKIHQLKKTKHFIKGGAILNKEGNMCGSVLFMQFETRNELDLYLENEIYITGKVWDKVGVIPIKLADV